MGYKNENWLYKGLTQEIIGASMAVHRDLGSGFLEYVYEESLKATKIRVGLLLNFGKKSLEIKRRIL